MYYYTYLIIQSKVKLTHTETQHPCTHRVACTHTHTHTHTHTRTHAHAHTHTHTHTRAQTGKAFRIERRKDESGEQIQMML